MKKTNLRPFLVASFCPKRWTFKRSQTKNVPLLAYCMQVIKNWTLGRPENEVHMLYIAIICASWLEPFLTELCNLRSYPQSSIHTLSC